MHVGLLIEGVLHDAVHVEIFNVAVVVEETIVPQRERERETMYCLNLEYHHNMKYSFEFLQRVIMKIKPDQCSARIHGLENHLLRYNL